MGSEWGLQIAFGGCAPYLNLILSFFYCLNFPEGWEDPLLNSRYFNLVLLKSSKVSSFEGSCSLTFDSAHSVAAKMVGRGELGRLSRRSRAPACHHPKTATGQCKNPAYKNFKTDIRKGLKQQSKIAGKKGPRWCNQRSCHRLCKEIRNSLS